MTRIDPKLTMLKFSNSFQINMARKKCEGKKANSHIKKTAGKKFLGKHMIACVVPSFLSNKQTL